MQVPSVSEDIWQWTRAICQLYLGTEYITPDELSFEKQVQTFVEPELETDTLIKDDTQATTSKESWWDGPAQQVAVTYEVGDRDHPRRPEVSDDTIEDVTELVKREYPGVPVDDLSFNKKLELLYERIQDALSTYSMHPITKEKYESTEWADTVHQVTV